MSDSVVEAGKIGYAFNLTRQTFLATQLRIAKTHAQRLRGLIGTHQNAFHGGAGLWIAPCRGIHTMFMRFPIDALYLDHSNRVIRIEENLRPWRITRVVIDAATVVELPAHTVWNTGTKVGDEMEMTIPYESKAGKQS